MSYFPVYRTRPDGSTEVAEIQANSVSDAYNKAVNWWHDAERILVPVPSSSLSERIDSLIEKNLIAGLDNPDDVA